MGTAGTALFEAQPARRWEIARFPALRTFFGASLLDECLNTYVVRSREKLSNFSLLSFHSHVLRGVVVAFADTLVSADFGVFPFPLLHKGLQLGIVGVRNSLRIHFDDELTASLLDASSDVHNGFLQPGDTGVLVEAGVGQDVERWGNKPDFDLVVFGVASLCCAQGGLDGVDTLVLEACYFDVGADLCGLGSQALSDV